MNCERCGKQLIGRWQKRFCSRLCGSIRHSDYGSKEYWIWLKMKGRCLNPKDKKYPDYGGRGITVCDEWQTSYGQFLNDMGRKPGPEYTLERIDNSGGYEPRNCRWATPMEQARNTRRNIRVTISGETRILADWCREFGIKDSSVVSQLVRRSGMTYEEALAVRRPA